jgi:hypothetical protein
MTSSLIERIETFPSQQIDWVWYDDYYDRPLSGWIRAGGKRYYYELLNETMDWYSLYGVYHVPRSVRIPHLLEHRMWRQMVGWTHDWRPGEPRGEIYRGMDGFKAFCAAQTELPDFKTENVRGITDLKEIRWLVDAKYDALEEDEL